MILIDGSDGGGQILRTAVALSAITDKPCKISNIRGSRPNPGLQAQHLSGIEAAAKMCNAELRAQSLEAWDVEFHPGKISGGKYSVDTGTAGSVTLVLQTLFPIASLQMRNAR
jgi:RNA 3'-terminal phosphate cyclase (ATP)